MEPEVQIVEINGERLYKMFLSGIEFKECTKEETAENLKGKMHLFLLLPSNMDVHEAHKTCGYFFSATKIESVSAMYSSVSASLALGVQNVVIISVEHSKQEEKIICSVDLVIKSSLVYTHSITKCMTYQECVNLILEQLYIPQIRESAPRVHIKGDPDLIRQIEQLLQEQYMFVEKKDEIDEEEAEIFTGYSKVVFPEYFERMMPHNMLPESKITYVGAVLTIMINYFEIKEVNTREDYETGITKNLLLN